MLVSELLYTALRLAGVIQLSGRTASTTEMADAFAALNALIDGWNAEQLAVYAIDRQVYSLTSATASYTIGTGATWDTARPAKIEAAHVIVGSPTIERPVKVCTAPEWAAIAFKGETSNLGPTSLFYEALSPTGTVYVSPIPSANMSIVLFVWAQLAQFAAQSDTVTLPVGYVRAITFNLAVELSQTPRFSRFPMDAGVAQKAAEFKAAIRELSAQLNYGDGPAASQPEGSVQ
jgi:hypothetical protein